MPDEEAPYSQLVIDPTTGDIRHVTSLAEYQALPEVWKQTSPTLEQSREAGFSTSDGEPPIPYSSLPKSGISLSVAAQNLPLTSEGKIDVNKAVATWGADNAPKVLEKAGVSPEEAQRAVQEVIEAEKDRAAALETPEGEEGEEEPEQAVVEADPEAVLAPVAKYRNDDDTYRLNEAIAEGVPEDVLVSLFGQEEYDRVLQAVVARQEALARIEASGAKVGDDQYDLERAILRIGYEVSKDDLIRVFGQEAVDEAMRSLYDRLKAASDTDMETRTQSADLRKAQAKIDEIPGAKLANERYDMEVVLAEANPKDVVTVFGVEGTDSAMRELAARKFAAERPTEVPVSLSTLPVDWYKTTFKDSEGNPVDVAEIIQQNSGASYEDSVAAAEALLEAGGLDGVQKHLEGVESDQLETLKQTHVEDPKKPGNWHPRDWATAQGSNGEPSFVDVMVVNSGAPREDAEAAVQQLFAIGGMAAVKQHFADIAAQQEAAAKEFRDTHVEDPTEPGQWYPKDWSDTYVKSGAIPSKENAERLFRDGGMANVEQFVSAINQSAAFRESPQRKAASLEAEFLALPQSEQDSLIGWTAAGLPLFVKTLSAPRPKEGAAYYPPSLGRQVAKSWNELAPDEKETVMARFSSLRGYTPGLAGQIWAGAKYQTPVYGTYLTVQDSGLVSGWTALSLVGDAFLLSAGAGAATKAARLRPLMRAAKDAEAAQRDLQVATQALRMSDSALAGAETLAKFQTKLPAQRGARFTLPGDKFLPPRPGIPKEGTVDVMVRARRADTRLFREMSRANMTDIGIAAKVERTARLPGLTAATQKLSAAQEALAKAWKDIPKKYTQAGPYQSQIVESLRGDKEYVEALSLVRRAQADFHAALLEYDKVLTPRVPATTPAGMARHIQQLEADLEDTRRAANAAYGKSLEQGGRTSKGRTALAESRELDSEVRRIEMQLTEAKKLATEGREPPDITGYQMRFTETTEPPTRPVSPEILRSGVEQRAETARLARERIRQFDAEQQAARAELRTSRTGTATLERQSAPTAVLERRSTPAQSFSLETKPTYRMVTPLENSVRGAPTATAGLAKQITSMAAASAVGRVTLVGANGVSRDMTIEEISVTPSGSLVALFGGYIKVSPEGVGLMAPVPVEWLPAADVGTAARLARLPGVMGQAVVAGDAAVDAEEAKSRTQRPRRVQPSPSDAPARSPARSLIEVPGATVVPTLSPTTVLAPSVMLAPTKTPTPTIVPTPTIAPVPTEEPDPAGDPADDPGPSPAPTPDPSLTLKGIKVPVQPPPPPDEEDRRKPDDPTRRRMGIRPPDIEAPSITEYRPLPPGTITWKHGAFWRYIAPPYKADKPSALPRGVAPVGALHTDGTRPAETIQIIGVSGAPVPPRISIDLGAVDIFIYNGRRIEYRSKGLGTNVGPRLDSAAQGMELEDNSNVLPDPSFGKPATPPTPPRPAYVGKVAQPRKKRRKMSGWDYTTTLKGFRP